ncbi:MAG: helix-turn-helix transcriptional regulator [Ignavibacteriales bacterium]|nr:helix-turn-helix transcriptional regulator [Ignavibacteriales bacterium]
MDYLNFIILLGIAHGILMGIALLTIRRGNRRANQVLGLLMISFAISITGFPLINAGYYKLLPHLLLVGHPFLFLFGPLMLLYVRLRTQRDFKLRRIHLLHLVPFIAYVVALVPFYLLSGEEKISLMMAYRPGDSFSETFVTPLQIVFVFTYAAVAFRELSRYEKRIKETFSSIEQISLSWIRSLISLVVAVFVVMSLLSVLSFLGYAQFVATHGGNIVPLLVTVCMYTSGYSGIRKPEVFVGGGSAAALAKYENSSLSEEQAHEYLKRLLETMEHQKPFVNSGLTIKDLAEKSTIPSYHLSRIINERLGQNFYDFINHYRVEETKRLFAHPEKQSYSIIAIAEEAGFNSKSVFNTAFKKYVNMTPSQYRQQLNHRTPSSN